MKICYFGLYDPEFSRNKVYISGLRQNQVEIVECRDTSPGLTKFWRLWRKHRDILRTGGYDAIIVGYPGHIVVPFARMISRKPIIFDALCSLYEAEVLSRGKYSSNPLMKGWIRLVDWMAVKSANIILVETNAQKDFFVDRFKVEPAKVVRIFTGVYDKDLQPEHLIQKRSKFTAVFRGKFLPEAGVKHIVKAAKMLESQEVDVLILGGGFLEEEIKAQIDSLKPLNLYWEPKYLDTATLYQRMRECHVSLGQFEKHDRLDRTIPHKAFESIALGIPYVTGRAKGIAEIFTDGKDCLMTNLADPDDIVVKVLRLKNDSDLAQAIVRNGHDLYEHMLTPTRLAQNLLSTIFPVRPVQI